MIKKLYEAALLFVGTLGWWGFVYPELCPDGEVYREEVLQEETSQEERAQEETDKNVPELRAEEAMRESRTVERPARKASSGSGTDTPSEGQEAPEGQESTGVPGQKDQTALGETECASAPVWELGEIRIKSRFLEYVYEMKENRQRKRD